jgi:uncharacterized protein (DUF433 family)
MKMIKRIPAAHKWPEKARRGIIEPRLPQRQSGQKWSFLETPLPPATVYLDEWLAANPGGRSEFRPTIQLSDDAIFRQAAAKVHHKIEIDPKILGGAPCVAGTRVPVYAILELIENGYSHKRILKSFPSIREDELEAALRFSAIVMER